jgi:fatty acid-binding protein DegV
MVKKSVLEAGDAQLLSQVAALQEVEAALVAEVAPLQVAANNALTTLNAANQRLIDASAAATSAQLAYDAAVTVLNNNSAELQAFRTSVADLTDQTQAIVVVSAAALRLGKLDETNPNGTPTTGN